MYIYGIYGYKHWTLAKIGCIWRHSTVLALVARNCNVVTEFKEVHPLIEYRFLPFLQPISDQQISSQRLSLIKRHVFQKGANDMLLEQVQTLSSNIIIYVSHRAEPPFLNIEEHCYRHLKSLYSWIQMSTFIVIWFCNKKYPFLEQMSTLLRDKLEMKKELVMSGLERRGEGERGNKSWKCIKYWGLEDE